MGGGQVELRSGGDIAICGRVHAAVDLQRPGPVLLGELGGVPRLSVMVDRLQGQLGDQVGGRILGKGHFHLHIGGRHGQDGIKLQDPRPRAKGGDDNGLPSLLVVSLNMGIVVLSHAHRQAHIVALVALSPDTALRQVISGIVLDLGVVSRHPNGAVFGHRRDVAGQFIILAGLKIDGDDGVLSDHVVGVAAHILRDPVQQAGAAAVSHRYGAHPGGGFGRGHGTDQFIAQKARDLGAVSGHGGLSVAHLGKVALHPAVIHDPQGDFVLALVGIGRQSHLYIFALVLSGGGGGDVEDSSVGQQFSKGAFALQAADVELPACIGMDCRYRIGRVGDIASIGGYVNVDMLYQGQIGAAVLNVELIGIVHRRVIGGKGPCSVIKVGHLDPGLVGAQVLALQIAIDVAGPVGPTKGGILTVVVRSGGPVPLLQGNGHLSVGKRHEEFAVSRQQHRYAVGCQLPLYLIYVGNSICSQGKLSRICYICSRRVGSACNAQVHSGPARNHVYYCSRVPAVPGGVYDLQRQGMVPFRRGGGVGHSDEDIAINVGRHIHKALDRSGGPGLVDSQHRAVLCSGGNNSVVIILRLYVYL